jgi:hypothetical protein
MITKVEKGGALRVAKGGGWPNSRFLAEPARAYRLEASVRDDELSFRLARRRSALEWLVGGPLEVSDGQEEEG